MQRGLQREEHRRDDGDGRDHDDLAPQRRDDVRGQRQRAETEREEERALRRQAAVLFDLELVYVARDDERDDARERQREEPAAELPRQQRRDAAEQREER